MTSRCKKRGTCRIAAPVLFSLCLTGSLLVSGGIGQAGKAADPPAAPTATPGVIDPAARALLDQMQDAQKALTSYSVTITVKVKFTGEKQSHSSQISFAFQKSDADDKIDKFYERFVNPDGKALKTFIFDGENYYRTSSSTPNLYTKRKMESSPRFVEMIIEDDNGFPRVKPLDTVLGDVGGISGVQEESKALTAVVQKPDEVVDGVTCDVVESTTVAPTQSAARGAANVNHIKAVKAVKMVKTIKTFAIGKTDHLARRVRVTMTDADDTAIKEEQQTAVFTTTYADVKANPTLPPSVFTFTPSSTMTVAKESALETFSRSLRTNLPGNKSIPK